jgi:hypothetical protein
VSPLLIEGVGWAATAVFVCSYFFERASLLRGAQMMGALLWLGYGLLIRSSPVIVANILVFAAAAWTLVRSHRAETRANPS